MGRILLGTVLLAMLERPAKAVADTPLEPITPGAWAAWAESYRAEQASARAGAGPAVVSRDRVLEPWTPRVAPGPHQG